MVHKHHEHFILSYASLKSLTVNRFELKGMTWGGHLKFYPRMRKGKALLMRTGWEWFVSVAERILKEDWSRELRELRSMCGVW